MRLPHGLTINSELYCSQLDRLQEAIKEKRSELINRKGVVFHYDNATHIFDDAPKIEGAWLGSFDAFTV